jgi:uncharacterized membrane protein YfcA
MNELTLMHWSFLVLGAAIMGLSKGGIPGAGNLTVALYVLVLEDALGPAGVALSVGLLLPVLISADLVSTIVYRKFVEWTHVRRLLPYFMVGVVAGWLTFDYFQAEGRADSLKVLIGVILLGMTLLRFVFLQLSRTQQSETLVVPRFLAPLLGLGGGMATMLANAAGPIAQFYLLAMRLPKYAFIGTSAWLFLIVNVSKVPLMYELDILNFKIFSVSAWLFLPAMLGALVAPKLVGYIRQDWFERMIWFFIVVAGLRMVF